MKPLVCLLFLALASPAAAQSFQPAKPVLPWHWGITAAMAPWQADDHFKGLYLAQKLDFAGNELRVGVTRGSRRRGEWALTYVRKSITEGSSFVTAMGREYRVGPQVRIHGFMAEQFAPLATIGEHAQIGLVLAGGIGHVSGSATHAVDGAQDLRKVLTIFAKPHAIHPLGRLELAAAVSSVPGVMIRFSGGFDWPGQTKLSVTAMYFFGDHHR
jgi:hypothetical protein